MATWVNSGRQRVVLGPLGEITSRMVIKRTPLITFPIADEVATPVVLSAYPNNTYLDDFVTVAECEAAMELIIG